MKMKFNFENAKKIVKKVGLPAAALLIGGTAMSQSGPNAGDMARNDKVFPMKSNESGPSADRTKATKVSSQPAGTTSYGIEGNREYFIRTTPGIDKGENVKPVKKPHKNFHYSSSIKKAFHKSNKPSEVKKDIPPGVELFYIEKTPEKVKEADPFAAYAMSNDLILNGRDQAGAYITYDNRFTNSIRDGGGKNTSKEDFALYFTNPNGVLTGNKVIVPAHLRNKVLNGPGNQLRESEEEIIRIVSEYNKNKTTYTLSQEELAKGTTLNNGDDIATSKE